MKPGGPPRSILRSAVVWSGVPEPVQVVRRRVTLPIEYHDWRSGAGDEAALLSFGIALIVPAAATVIVPWNDPEALTAAADQFELAAILAEPVPANMGVVPPAPGFLELLSECAELNGALLIFDEVITGFRVARGGAQELYGVPPDLTVMGKVLGGGLPAACFGGSRELMEHLAPAGDVYQAGTLSGNPLATAAGSATLAQLDEAAYARLYEAEQATLGAVIDRADAALVSDADLLPHEFNHSWDGKFRLPYDLATRNLQAPMIDDLLWVYEGMTQFYGNLQAERSGLRSKQEWLDGLADDRQPDLTAVGPGPAVGGDQGVQPGGITEPGPGHVHHDHGPARLCRFALGRFALGRLEPDRCEQGRLQPVGVGDVDLLGRRHDRHALDHLDREAGLRHLRHLLARP